MSKKISIILYPKIHLAPTEKYLGIRKCLCPVVFGAKRGKIAKKTNTWISKHADKEPFAYQTNITVSGYYCWRESPKLLCENTVHPYKQLQQGKLGMFHPLSRTSWGDVFLVLERSSGFQNENAHLCLSPI